MYAWRALRDDAELSAGGAPASSTLRHTVVRAGVARVHQTDRQRRSARIDRDPAGLWRHALPWDQYPHTVTWSHGARYKCTSHNSVQYTTRPTTSSSKVVVVK